MAITTRSATAAILCFTLVALAAIPARANLFSLAASGTISINSSVDTTIPFGTPWSFELIYNTAAPDLDFELSGAPPDPTFGRFTNTSTPPALTSFHYRAGDYEVTLDDPADFGPFSAIHITFLAVAHAFDVNIFAPAFFPPLAGGAVSFHADFNAFSTVPVFSSDALPTNTALSLASFDQSTVSLLPPAGVVSSSSLTSLTLTAVPPGDYNLNGTVDAADYTLWRDHLGQTFTLPNENPAATTHGLVDNEDYTFWKLHFGESSGSASLTTTTIPEPAAISIFIVGIAALFASRRANRRRITADG